MAFCSSCGTEISPAAVACPQCGQPTGVSPTGSLEYADFWTRFAGAIVDAILVAAASYLLMFGTVPWLGGFVIGFLYHWLTVAYWTGQTVGRRVLNIRVARPDGSAVDPGGAAGRAAMRIVSGLPFGLGFLWAAWDPEKRTWHDMVADTRVYRVR
jgi:uncharacterized RDD family membrane protein YckC